MKPILIVVVTFLFLACGQSSPDVEPPAEPSTGPADPPEEVLPIFDVHEWGLINVRDGNAELATGHAPLSERHWSASNFESS